MEKIPLEELKDYYYIDEYGNIYSYYKGIKKLKPLYDKDGYLIIKLLTKTNKYKFYRINRLVGITFIPNPNNYPIVHHKDNNKVNNHVSNLEWTTVRQNTLERYKINNYHFVKKVKAILPTGEELIFNSVKECAEYFEITYFDISKIANKKINVRKRGRIANINFEFI